jgi:hypothetical protein
MNSVRSMTNPRIAMTFMRLLRRPGNSSMPTSGRAVIPRMPASIGASSLPGRTGSALPKTGACVLQPTVNVNVALTALIVLGVTEQVIVVVAGVIDMIEIVVTPLAALVAFTA